MSTAQQNKTPIRWQNLSISLFSALILTIWFAFDHRLAGIDESGHIINANQAREILAHARIWKLDWWNDLLTINGFYPPFVYITNGFLRLAFTDAAWVDALSLILFDLGLSASVFGITWLVTKCRASSILAVVILHCYPLISYLSHTPLLDFPLETMIALGVFSLLWWTENLTWKRSIVCAVALALACLTKQIAVAFLLPPALWLTAKALIEAPQSERLKVFGKALLVAVVTASALALWYYLNRESIAGLASYNRTIIGDTSMASALIANLKFYAIGTPHNMSVLLLSLFFFALCFLGKSWKSLAPILLSAAGGMCIISLITWTAPLDRYQAPALIAPAVVTAVAAVSLWQGLSNQLALKTAGRLFVALAGLTIALQYLSYNFMPYPLNLGASLASIANKLGVSVRLYRDELVVNDSPRPAQDWGQVWTLERIRQIDGEAPVWLNILPCTPDTNAHTFEVVAHRIRSKAKPTTSRIWTLLGDKVEFSEKTAQYYQWYLISDGNQGNQLLDQASIKAYADFHDFVTKSGKFTLIDSFRLPNQLTIKLYRQK